MSGEYASAAQAQALGEQKALVSKLDHGIRRLFGALGVGIRSNDPGDIDECEWFEAIHRAHLRARDWRLEADRFAARLEAGLPVAQPTRPTVSPPASIPMLLWCPACGERHIDRGEFTERPHHTHACQHCGMVWRPAVVATCGVEFLPRFKDQ